jgi:hypothetical protein
MTKKGDPSWRPPAVIIKGQWMHNSHHCVAARRQAAGAEAWVVNHMAHLLDDVFDTAGGDEIVLGETILVGNTFQPLHPDNPLATGGEVGMEQYFANNDANLRAGYSNMQTIGAQIEWTVTNPYAQGFWFFYVKEPMTRTGQNSKNKFIPQQEAWIRQGTAFHPTISSTETTNNFYQTKNAAGSVVSTVSPASAMQFQSRLHKTWVPAHGQAKVKCDWLMPRSLRPDKFKQPQSNYAVDTPFTTAREAGQSLEKPVMNDYCWQILENEAVQRPNFGAQSSSDGLRGGRIHWFIVPQGESKHWWRFYDNMHGQYESGQGVEGEVTADTDRSSLVQGLVQMRYRFEVCMFNKRIRGDHVNEDEDMNPPDIKFAEAAAVADKEDWNTY